MTPQQIIAKTVMHVFEDIATPGLVRTRILDAADAQLVKLALHRCKNNQCVTAKYLGINRNTLRKLIKRHGIQL